MGVVLGVILGGVVLAAIFGAIRERGGSKSLWGNRKQAIVLILLLIILLVAIAWAYEVDRGSQL